MTVRFPSEFHTIYSYEDTPGTVMGPLWYSSSQKMIRFDRKPNVGTLVSLIQDYNLMDAFLVNRTSAGYSCMTWKIQDPFPDPYNMSNATMIGNDTVKGEPCDLYESTGFRVWISQRSELPFQAWTRYRKENYLFFKEERQDPSVFELPVSRDQCTFLTRPFDECLKNLFRV